MKTNRTEIGKQFDTIWGGLLFTIIVCLFVYFACKHVEDGLIIFLYPLGMFVLPLIIYPLCDCIGNIIQDFIDIMIEKYKKWID